MRLIDAGRLVDKFCHMPELVYTDVIARAIRAEPTVDAVQVVRCLDCKRWKFVGEYDGAKYGECLLLKHGTERIKREFHEEWFCAGGEKA